MAIPFQVTFDCADPDRLATFWATALGYKLQDPPPGFASWPAFLTAQGIPEDQWNTVSAIIDPEGRGSRIFFQVDAAVERLVAAGASTIRSVEQHGEYWVVMADPEGNEFCVQ